MLDREILDHYRELWKEKLEVAVSIGVLQDRQKRITAEMATLEDRIMEILGDARLEEQRLDDRLSMGDGGG